MKLQAAWATDIGQVRDGNEDSLLVDDRIGVFAVADGMGGHRGGEVASSTAVEAVRVSMASGASIETAIQSANTAIRERAFGDPNVAGMGTTFTAIVPLDDSNVLIGHVGDSRAYLLRGDTLRRLTRDHSLVEDLVRDGRITREQAEVHPQRAIITRALGIEPEIEVDLYTVRVTEGDRLLICSDGLTDMLSEPDVSRIACEQPDGAVAAHALVDAANTAGGVDNITVVLLDVVEVEDDGGFVDHGAALADPVPDAQPLTDSSLGTSSQGAEGTPGVDRPRRLWHLTRSTLRVLAVVVPIVVIVGIAFGAVWYRATHSYFVNQVDGEVVIERGVPGDILWFESTIVERTGLKTGTLTTAERLRLGNGFCETSSRSNAQACVEELKARRPAASTTTNYPSTSTSTSTSRTTSTTARSTPS